MEVEQKLMGEYSAGQKYVSTLHEQIWQSGAVLIVGSLGIFALLARFDEVTVASLVASILGGLLSTALVVIWYHVRKRFASFIQISYYRLQEIESELGLWRNRYIHHLDNPHDAELRELSKNDRDRLERLEKAFSGKREHTKLRAATMTKLLACLVPVAWSFWIAYQVVVLSYRFLVALLSKS